ncbi:envelope glycoprotein H [Gallid alphaherpesvirus 1]|uniref:Envelope glycoprotein H n=1 Tax=Infectious laryngotracheitis virus TaxID=10386 RepID=A0A0K0K5R7_ILTV|nr:envelope glycoprotein H [Gallid alphaherpesvirus 1]
MSFTHFLALYSFLLERAWLHQQPAPMGHAREIFFLILAILLRAKGDDKAKAKIVFVPPTSENLAPPKEFIAIATAVENGHITQLCLVDRNLIFGPPGSANRNLSIALDLLGQLYVAYTYSRWGSASEATIQPRKFSNDPKLEHRLLVGYKGNALTSAKLVNFPPNNSVHRGESIIAPIRVIYSDPLQTVFPFVFTRYISLAVTSDIDLKINIGLNVATLIIATQHSPQIEMIITPTSAKVKETSLKSWPYMLKAEDQGLTVRINVAAGPNYRPNLFTAVTTAAQDFLELASFDEQISAGHFLTLQKVAIAGCPNTIDESFFVRFAARFMAAWFRFLKFTIDAYVTDSEIVEFIAGTQTWADQVAVCFGGANSVNYTTNIRFIQNVGGALTSIPSSILKIMRDRPWEPMIKNHNLLLTIMNAVLITAEQDPQNAFLASIDGVTPSQLALEIIGNSYREIITQKVMTPAYRKLLAVSTYIILRAPQLSIQHGRNFLRRMTILCSVDRLADINEIHSQPDGSFKKGQASKIEEWFSPCAIATRFDISRSAPWKIILTASAPFRFFYTKVYSSSEGELPSYSAPIPPQALLTPQILATAFFPEVKKCLHWDLEHHIVFFLPVTAHSSWVMTSSPPSTGMTYRLPDTSTAAPLFVTFVNSSCNSLPQIARTAKMEDGHLNGRAKTCIYCNHLIVQYGLRGFRDAFFIDSAYVQSELLAGANSSIAFFKSMNPEFYNYALLGPHGTAVRILGLDRSIIVFDKAYIIGIVVGALVGLVALWSAIRAIYKFCLSSATQFRRVRLPSDEESEL